MIGATTAGVMTARYKDAKFDAFKSASEAAYAKAQAQAVVVELKNLALAKELDNAYTASKRDLDRLSSELAGVRLRDPHARSCPMPSAAAPAAESQDPASGAYLSDELTQLLLSESRRADEAALYAQTCYEWIENVQAK